MRADARATHQSVITAMDVLGPRVCRGQYRDGQGRDGGQALNDTLAQCRNEEYCTLGGGALRAYRRLLGYCARMGASYLGSSRSVVSPPCELRVLAKKFGDGTFTHQTRATIVWVPLALIGLFILRGLGDFTQTYFMGYVGRRIVSSCRREVFRHILHLPIGYFDRSSSARCCRASPTTPSRSASDTDSVIIAVRTTLTIIASSAFCCGSTCVSRSSRSSWAAGGWLVGHQPEVPPLQPPHPGLEWRRHRVAKEASRPRASSRSTTPRSIGPQFDAGERSQPALEHEARSDQGSLESTVQW